MKVIIPVILVLLFLGGNDLWSQTKPEVIKDSSAFTEQEETMRSYDSLLEEQNIILNRHPQDSEIGSFEVKNKNENFSLRIGGFVKLTTYYDVGLENNLFFNMYQIKTDGTKPKGRVNFQVYESRLNTEVVGQSSLGLYRVYIEGDFLGNGGGSFRLRHAFGQFQGFTFGQTWSFFMDASTTPFSVDLNGPPGATFARKPLIGYRNSSWIKNSTIGISFENPNSDIFATQQVNRPQLYPDFVLNYKFDSDGKHLKVAGILRSFIYDDTIATVESTTDGYGVMVSGSIKPTKRIKLSGQFIYGRGISEYLSFDQDLIPLEDGSYRTPRTYSIFASATYKVNFRSNVSVFYSFVNLKDTYTLPDTQFSVGQQFNANYIFELSPTVKTGVEVIHGLVENIGGSTGTASRLYLFFLLSF